MPGVAPPAAGGGLTALTAIPSLLRLKAIRKVRPMRDEILGICRFSFLGKCDWAETVGPEGDSPDLLARRAAMLYAPDRLARRFTAFETLCLPSIRAQTDTDFRFILLTSPQMPKAWLERLQDLCADQPRISLLVSDAASTADALRAPLARAAETAGRPVIQFRVDDDDAFSRHHVARIRRNAARFADLPGFALSWPQGLVYGSYDGAAVTFWRAHQPFLGAGVAVRMRAAGRSIFAFNHFQLPKHFPAFSDISGLGYVQTRWDEGDSVATIVARFPKWFQPLTEAAFRDALRDDFPFLLGRDLGFSQKKGAA